MRKHLDDLVEALPDAYDELSPKEQIQTFLEAIKVELENGNEVAITGFGTFETKEVAERKSTLPKTKGMVVPAHKRVRFTVSDKLNKQINEGKQ